MDRSAIAGTDAANLDEVVEIALANGLVLDRLRGTGRLTNHTAHEMQVCGIAGRASGIDADARRDHPFAAFGELSPRVVVLPQEDVGARLMVRVREAHESIRSITRALETLPAGPLVEPPGPWREGGCALGLVEG